MSNPGIKWARQQKVGNPAGAKAVLVVHADHANDFGASWPKKETVAQATGLSKRTVENYERLLIERGLLIPVPWVYEDGSEGRKGFFLAFARRTDESLPDVFEAFQARMEYAEEGGRRSGRPRLEIPSWWSGDKTATASHKCTSCGRRCHGSDHDGWDRGEGPMGPLGGPLEGNVPGTFLERSWNDSGVGLEGDGEDPHGGPMGPPWEGGQQTDEGIPGILPESSRNPDGTPSPLPPAGPGEGPARGRGEGPARGTPITLSTNPHPVTPTTASANALAAPSADADDGADARPEGGDATAPQQWLPADREARLAEWKHIVVAIDAMTWTEVDVQLNRTTLADKGASHRGRTQITDRQPELKQGEELTRMTLKYVLSELPLASWPLDALPQALRCFANPAHTAPHPATESTESGV